VVLEQAVRLLGAAAAMVLLLDPVQQALADPVARGLRTPLPRDERVRLGHGFAGRAALERRLVAVPNVAEHLAESTNPDYLVAEGIRALYAVPLIAKGQVLGVLQLMFRTPHAAEPGWLDFLQTLAGQAAIAIENGHLFERLQRSHTELTLAYDATIAGWSHALDLRDHETEGHSQRVTDLTLRLAQTVGLPPSELVHVRRGALLHDIGKMAIPDAILLKPGPLTAEEWAVMRQHPTHAYHMLAPIAFLRPALDIPYCHHEKWDGTGYPRGLKGEEIPMAARVFAVADVWDALRSNRPYRLAWPVEQVREHIRSLAGVHFDPEAVEAFFGLRPDEGPDPRGS
jgi:putative nucleotidyltransferase with HDIG domain